jgi:hypothetical protein
MLAHASAPHNPRRPATVQARSVSQVTCQRLAHLTVNDGRRGGHQSSTVAALSKRVGVRTKADYKALKDEEVETVRLTCEDARTAVEQHRKEHGCLELSGCVDHTPP